MGCATSRKDVNNVLLQCRERKRLLKLALERRCEFANAHCKYILSLFTVAKAMRLFVARLSTPSTYLITNPSTCESSETTDNKPTLLQQAPPEPKHGYLSCQPSNPTVSLYSSEKEKEKQEQKQKTQVDKKKDDGLADEECNEEEEESEEDDMVCEHYYDEVTPPMPSLQREVQFGWDFFSPYDRLKAQMLDGFDENLDENLPRIWREEEGIPELEKIEERVMSEIKVQNACFMGPKESGVSEVIIEDNSNVIIEETKHLKFTDTTKNKSGFSDVEKENDVNVKVIDTPRNESGVSDVKVGEGVNVSAQECGVLTVIDAPKNGRELLEALKDIEGFFFRAYESGVEVSRMLEAKSVQLQTGLEGIKESSGKGNIIRSIKRKGSISSRSISCRSIFSSSPRSSSSWTEFKKNLFEEYGGMESGSQSLTLTKLYAWEQKLYDSVKAGEQFRKLYDRRCIQLRNMDAREGPFHAGKTRAEVIALHARISVSIRSAETISEKIVKVRDEELHPQLVELLKGLMNTWKIMLEFHEKQSRIMLEVASFNCPTYEKFCNKSHRLATLELETELQNWRVCFSEYVSSQKAYLEALNGWISKCIAPEVERNSKDNSSASTCGIPLVVVCHDWLACLEKLPSKAVTCAMKNFGKDMRALYVQQGKEQEQKRKVDVLAKELDRKVKAFQNAENRILKSKLSEQDWEVDAQDRLEYLAGSKNSLEMFKNRLEKEKAKQLSGMQGTKGITLNGIQTGFSSVFESLIGFSKAFVDIYADLVRHNGDAKETNEDCSNPSQGAQMDSRPLN